MRTVFKYYKSYIPLIVGILAFHEPVNAPRLIFVGLLLVGIVGLKLTA